MSEGRGEESEVATKIPTTELGLRVLEAAPVMILVLAADGTIQYANPFFERLSGYKLDEVRGKDWFDTFLPARDRERIRELFRQCFDGAHVERKINPIITRGGEEREIEWTDEFLRDVAGHIVGLLAIGHDVTERVRAQEEAHRSSRLLHAVVTGAPVVNFALDRDGVFTLSEGRGLAKLGLAPGEVVGRSALEMYAHVPEIAGALRRALAGEQTTITVRLGDLHFEVVYAPSVDARGNAEGVIGVAFDVSERERAEAELQASVLAQQQLVDELRDVDRRKNDFIAVLSHELRNPLSTIQSGLCILDELARGSSPARNALDVVERQTALLGRLVDDLLDVSRLTLNKIRLQHAPVDLAQLVMTVVEDHRTYFELRRVRLDLQRTEACVMVTGDAARLTQVISNLIGNAAKFTPAGGCATVAVAIDREAKAAVVRVTDTGEGIAPEMVERVFEPFAQAERTLARSKGGLGLGLALVKGLVELHGGKVCVHSEGEGRGAAFEVRLPIAPTLAPSPQLLATAPHALHRVLLIEDNVDAAETLGEVLRLEGHTVEIAHDGPEGIESARRFRPEVVLCDIGLPGLTGYEVAQALVRDETMPPMRLIALSGYASPDDVARSRAAGFAHHLAKPVALGRLRDVLDQK
ncbi:MAG: PAS domain-containing protein [Kofleriaceae bacterium]|nr:PAS domain-containing protein [Kofleriaceae bacterium]